MISFNSVTTLSKSTVDTTAAPGSPAETGGTLHRIDPELLKRDFAAAGFVLDAESDVLRNYREGRMRVAQAGRAQ